MKTIVTLVDFSDVTPQLLEQSRQMAGAFQAKVILVHTVPAEAVVMELGLLSPTVMQAASEKRIEGDYNKLLDVRDSLAAAGVDVTAEQLEDPNVEKVMQLSQQLHADLIIVGSHHHSSLYQLLMGTYTSDVLQRASCPVLVVPAVVAAAKG